MRELIRNKSNYAFPVASNEEFPGHFLRPRSSERCEGFGKRAKAEVVGQASEQLNYGYTLLKARFISIVRAVCYPYTRENHVRQIGRPGFRLKSGPHGPDLACLNQNVFFFK